MSCSVSSAMSPVREAVIERQDGERHLIGSGEALRLLPALGERRLAQLVLGKQPLQPLARADGIARQDDLGAGAAKLADVLDDRFVDVEVLRALRREIPAESTPRSSTRFESGS
jgi:hypothetical protein